MDIIDDRNAAKKGNTTNNKQTTTASSGPLVGAVKSAVSSVTDIIKIESYGIFKDAYKTTKTLGDKCNDAADSLNKIIAKLSDDSVFKGPAADDIREALKEIQKNMKTINDNMGNISTYLSETAERYKAGDEKAGSQVVELTGLDGNKIKIDGKGSTLAVTTTTSSGKPLKTTEIPNNVKQTNYTVTCYAEGGWYMGGTNFARVSSGTSQEKVNNLWVKNGAKFTNGVATIEKDGKTYNLVAMTDTYGDVGDKVALKLENGQTVNCIIADQKSSGDSNWSKWGHTNGSGTNVLELEVNKDDYAKKGNPTTESYGLDWESSSPIVSVDNYGSVIKK